jgi:hypothetical protein
LAIIPYNEKKTGVDIAPIVSEIKILYTVFKIGLLVGCPTKKSAGA